MLKLLRDILNSKEIVKVEEDKILVNGNPIDDKEMVEFKLCEQKYALISVILYIIDRKAKHIDYIKKCKPFSVTPIKLNDKENIVEEIKSYKEEKLKGEFLKMQYATGRKYYVPPFEDINYILVGYDITKKIGLSNVEAFLKDKKVIKNTGSGIISASKEFECEGYKFKVFNDFSKFTEEEWNMVKIVFIDGIEKELKTKCKFYEKVKENAVFIAFEKPEDKNISIFTPIVKEDTIINYSFMWDDIKNIIS